MIVTVLSHSNPQYGLSALRWASFEGDADIVQELITGGAQVNLQYEVKHNIN